MPPYSGSGRGGGLSDEKRKIPDTLTTGGPDRRGHSIQGGNEVWRSFLVCARCRRHHSGECRAMSCFLCGIVGHFKKDWMRLKNGEPRSVDSSTPTRVSALMQLEPEASPSEVTGWLSSSCSFILC